MFHAFNEPEHSRDDWNKFLDNGMPFSDFCPDWRNAQLWQEWSNYTAKCFGTGTCCVHTLLPIVSYFTDVTEQAVGDKDNGSKKQKTRVPITKDANGELEIPLVSEDTHHAKAIQDVVRDYCLGHIREYAPHSAL